MSREQIASGLRRSLRIVARHRSTCGTPMLSLPPPTAAALPRSCVGPVNRSRWCGPGRRGSWRRAVEGLLRDKTRKPGKPPLPPNTVQRVVDLALGPPSGESTHWTGRELAKAAGVSLRSVQRILEAHQLAPHRIRTFKLSKDPEFVEKLRDIVGLYVDPPAHAVVLSVDEKSQVQALDRT